MPFMGFIAPWVFVFSFSAIKFMLNHGGSSCSNAPVLQSMLCALAKLSRFPGERHHIPEKAMSMSSAKEY
jgi:hypothetical protein